MKAICGANCDDCELFKSKKCEGCVNTNACPFGKKCWIAKYIEIGGNDSFNELKKRLINEINSLDIPGMPNINELYSLNGTFINQEYILPNNAKTKFLNDNEVYLGNQVECDFNDKTTKKYFGVVTNMTFILISEYEEDGSNPELIIYKKR